jgi:hypothetical protein
MLSSAFNRIADFSCRSCSPADGGTEDAGGRFGSPKYDISVGFKPVSPVGDSDMHSQERPPAFLSVELEESRFETSLPF